MFDCFTNVGQCAHGALWVHPCVACGRPDYAASWVYETDPGAVTAAGTGALLRLWPMDADGNALVGYWRCTCGTVVPPDREHRCPSEEVK